MPVRLVFVCLIYLEDKKKTRIVHLSDFHLSFYDLLIGFAEARFATQLGWKIVRIGSKLEETTESRLRCGSNRLIIYIFFMGKPQHEKPETISHAFHSQIGFKFDGLS